MLLLVACSDRKEEPKVEPTPQKEKAKRSEPPEDYVARLIEGRWRDLDHLDAEDFAAQMKVYIEGDDPIYSEDHRLMRRMLRALVRLRPEIAPLKALLGPRPEGPVPVDEEGDPIISDGVLKRDYVGCTVVDSFIIRIERGDPARAPLFDGIAYAGVHFSFEPLFGEAPTSTAVDVGEYMIKDAPLCPEAEEAVERYLEPLIERWRKRVATNATSATFGYVLRFMGPRGADRLFLEWERMDADERVSLLNHVAYGDLTKKGLESIARAMLEEDLDVRRNAIEALEQHGAPVLEIDASSRESEIRKVLPKVLKWIAETRS